MTTIRRASLAVLAILVLENGIGVYVSRYATVRRADHGAGLTTAIARGPAALSTHAVLGLLPRPASPGKASPAPASTAQAGTA